MEIRQLRYFKAIADAGSFARAAHSLRVAQPALSRSISKLEAELGCILFVRHNAGVALTDAGQRLSEHAARILDDLKDLAEGMAAKDDDRLTGEVSLGAPQSIQTILALPTGADFVRQNPLCRLILTQNSSTRLRDHLLQGAIDNAIIPTAADTGFHVSPLVKENICLVVPASERAGFPEIASIDILVGLPIVLSGYPNTLNKSLEHLLGRSVAELDIRCEVNSSGMLIDLVLLGAGYGIAPASATAPCRDRGVDVVPIDGFTVSWAIATNWNRRGSGAVQEIQRLLIERARALVLDGAWPTATLLAD